MNWTWAWVLPSILGYLICWFALTGILADKILDSDDDWFAAFLCFMCGGVFAWSVPLIAAAYVIGKLVLRLRH